MRPSTIQTVGFLLSIVGSIIFDYYLAPQPSDYLIAGLFLVALVVSLNNKSQNANSSWAGFIWGCGIGFLVFFVMLFLNQIKN